MTNFVGMDPAEVRQVGRTLEAQSRRLAEVTAEVDVLVRRAAAAWEGRSAHGFAQLWSSDLRSKLLSAQGSMHNLGQIAQQNADEQQRASSSAGATPLSGRHALKPPKHYTTPSAGDYRDLSRAAYPKQASPEGWTHADKAQLKAWGITPDMLDDPKSGFHAEIFVDKAGNPVVSYRGTEGMGNMQDVRSDAEGAVYLSGQTEKAVLLSKAMKSAVGADHVTYTGHSLGGRLAAVSSLATGSRAVTFNAAGVSGSEIAFIKLAAGQEVSYMQYVLSGAPGTFSDDRDAAAHNVVNFYTPNDVLTNVQRLPGVPDALGTQVENGRYDVNAISSHNLDHFNF